MTKFKEITDKRVDDVISIIRTGFPGRYSSSNVNNVITTNENNNGDDQSNDNIIATNDSTNGEDESNNVITANDNNNDSITNTAIYSDVNELYRSHSSYSDSDSDNTNHLEIDTHSNDTVNHLSHSTEETFIKISEEVEQFYNLSDRLNNIHISEPTINNLSISTNDSTNGEDQSNDVITTNDSINGEDESNNVITANDSNNDSVTNTAIYSDCNELYGNLSSYSDSVSENTNHLEIDETVNHLSHSTEETFIEISEEVEQFDNLSNIPEPTINNSSISDNTYINNSREVQELELNFPFVYDFKKQSIIQNDSDDSLEKIYCFDFAILSKGDATNLYHNLLQECNEKKFIMMFKENILDMITLSTTKKKQAEDIMKYLKKKDNPNKNLNIYRIGSCKKDFEKAMGKIWKFNPKTKEKKKRIHNDNEENDNQQSQNNIDNPLKETNTQSKQHKKRKKKRKKKKKKKKKSQQSKNKKNNNKNIDSCKNENNTTNTRKRKLNTHIQNNRNKPFHSGLINFGNTCYMNSVLQLLFSIPDIFETTSKSTDPLVKSLRNLYMNVAPKNGKSIVIEPLDFKNEFDKIYNNFPTGFQYDAQEFLMAVLNSLWPNDPKHSTSPFLFEIEKTTECTECNSSWKKIEHLTQLNVSSPTNETKTVHDLLTSYFSNENYEQNCGNCDKSSQTIWLSKFKSLPKYLVIHLKRYDYVNENNRNIKNNKEVSYSKTLDMSQFLQTKEGKSTSSTSYSLRATINHVGANPNSGHYVANCYREKENHPGQWMKFDDSTVTPISSKEMNNSTTKQNIYILLYVRNDTSNDEIITTK